IMIGVGLTDDQEDSLGQVGHIGISRDLVLGNDSGSVSGARVVHIETRIRGVLRVEGQTEQPAFPAEQDLGPDIEKDRRGGSAGLENLYDSPLLHDEEAVCAVVRVCKED